MMNITQRLFGGPYRALAKRSMEITPFWPQVLRRERPKKEKYCYRSELYSSTELHGILGVPSTSVEAFRSLLARLTKRTNREVTKKIEARLRSYVPKRSHKKPLT